MNEVLTGVSGIIPQERSKDKSFFRVMSRMAITEEQSLVRIKPNAGATIMRYNPNRDKQIYLSDLVCVGVSGSIIEFVTEKHYSLAYNGIEFVYLNGMMFGADSIVGDTVFVSSVAAANVIHDAYDSGLIKSYSDIKASLLTEPCIDYQLNWQDIIDTEIIGGLSDELTDVPIRVKSGLGGDSYSQWREMMPNGITTSYTGDGISVMLNMDVGVVCASLTSEYAPQMIELMVLGSLGPDYSIYIYLNIDDIPSSLLPWYPMHPGQSLHDVSSVEGWEGSADGAEITVSGDMGTLSVDDVIEITHKGMIRECIIDVISGNVITLRGNIRGLNGSVYLRKITYDYIDGELFKSDKPEDFTTPHRAYMFIIRCALELMTQPHLSSVGSTLNICNVIYRYHQGVDTDFIYPSYAACHYDAGYIDGKYAETCKIDNDTVERMRYVGHYGRNPVYGNSKVDNGTFIVDSSVKAYTLKDKDIVSDMGAISIGKTSIDINLSDVVHSVDIKHEKVINGFYKVVSNPLPAKIASSVMVSKIYLLQQMVQDDVIYAIDTSDGYKLIKENGGTEDDNFYNAHIGNMVSIKGGIVGYEGVTVTEPPSSGYVMIGSEVIKYINGTGSEMEIEQRACFGSNVHNIKEGDNIYYVSYLTYNDIHPNATDACSYQGRYKPRITLPASNTGDPQLFGAVPVYLVEVQYESYAKTKAQ